MPLFQIAPNSSHKRLLIALCLCCVLSYVETQAAEQEVRHAFKHPCMGTQFTFYVYADTSDETESAMDKAVQAAIDRIEAINAAASDYLPESELSRFNRAPAHVPFAVGKDLFRLVQTSLHFAKITHGAFDITAMYAIQNWRRSRRQKTLPKPEQTTRAIAMTDWRLIELDAARQTLTKKKQGVQIDLGGIGKGYAADQALAVLRDTGFPRSLVAASGDLAIGDAPLGSQGWPVSLKTFDLANPRQPHEPFHHLNNCGCSTSGDLHQFVELAGKRWSHIIDPKTGLGLTQRIACTVIAPNATTSDALDTAGCVLGKERSFKLFKAIKDVSFQISILSKDDGEVQTFAHGRHFE